MVSRKTDERETVNSALQDDKLKKPTGAKGRKKSAILMMIYIFITAFTVVCLVLLLVMSFIEVPAAQNDETIVGDCPSLNGVVVNNNDCNSLSVIKPIDFQNTIDEWVNSINGEKGVIIYDLMAGKMVGQYNADQKFATASLYKLFVVYEGYLKLVSGEWSFDESAGSTGYSIGKCLDLAIRESHSGCAETLWGMIGRDELDAIVQSEYGLPDVVVGSLSATPREIMRMMLKYFQHTEIDDENLVAMMKDSFLNQPITSYNWRQGLPSGFSDSVRVYNKVGWHFNGSIWEIYDDAAIIDFVNADRIFIVVVMSNRVNFKNIVEFGRMLEDSFNLQND